MVAQQALTARGSDQGHAWKETGDSAPKVKAGEDCLKTWKWKLLGSGGEKGKERRCVWSER